MWSLVVRADSGTKFSYRVPSSYDWEHTARPTRAWWISSSIQLKDKVLPVQTKKACRGSRGTAPLTRILGVWLRWEVNFTPWLFFQLEKTPVPIWLEAWWTVEPVWKYVPAGIPTWDRPAHGLTFMPNTLTHRFKCFLGCGSQFVGRSFSAAFTTTQCLFDWMNEWMIVWSVGGTIDDRGKLMSLCHLF